MQVCEREEGYAQRQTNVVQCAVGWEEGVKRRKKKRRQGEGQKGREGKGKANAVRSLGRLE